MATNPSVFGEEALTTEEAGGAYDSLLEDERISFRPEPAGLESRWRRHTRDRRYSHKVWSDAYLVAFAETSGVTMVTFDRGLGSYEGAEPTILEAP